MMKNVLKLAGMVSVAGLVGFASNVRAQGHHAQESEYPAAVWAKPISNPVYTDLAIQKSEINTIYIYNAMPRHVDIGGASYDLDGEFHAFAVQAEIPLMDKLSFVADKSGAIIFRPDDEMGLFDSNEGLTNLAAGLKYAFYEDEKIAAAVRGTVELPTGDTEVFQGNGDGSFSPALLLTHFGQGFALNGVVGANLPFDSSELSTMGYAAVSGACKLTDKLSGHLELNWFRVLEAGHGETDFNDLGQGTHNILPFEGGDLINLGATDSEKHPDFVSLAVGARYQITDRVNVGVAYEQPLSTKDRGLMGERVTVDLGMTF